MNVPIKRMRLGTQLFFRIHVRQSSSATQPLANPSSGVKITVRQSNGAVHSSANDVAMTNESTGVYTFSLQTASTDPQGVWRVSFKMVDGGTTVLTVPFDAVEMVP